jgi:hypothetical protein
MKKLCNHLYILFTNPLEHNTKISQLKKLVEIWPRKTQTMLIFRHKKNKPAHLPPPKKLPIPTILSTYGFTHIERIGLGM